MPNSGKRVDPIPNEFATYEDAAAFWDTHNTTDYPDAFQTVEVEEVTLRQRRYEVEIDEDVVHMLQEQARKRDLPYQPPGKRSLAPTAPPPGHLVAIVRG